MPWNSTILAVASTASRVKIRANMIRLRILASGDDLFHDVAVDVGQAEVAAGVAVGEALVIEAEQMQDRRVQVVYTRRLFDGLESEIVGRPVNRAAANSTAGQPDAEPVMVVVSPKLRLAVAAQLDGRRP